MTASPALWLESPPNSHHPAEPPVWLRARARRLAESSEIWWPRIRRRTGSRWYVPLTADEDHEAWLLGWPAGGGIELHDHGDSFGAVCVLEGALVETYASRPGPSGASGRMDSRRLAPGSLIAFGPDHVHDIANHGPAQALSIHVYAPRLRSMTFYEPGRDGALVAVRTEINDAAALLV
jgi:hypothetical protein